MQSLGNLKKQLLEEGYKEVYIWKDSPNTNYPPHKHLTSTKIIILEGSIFLTLEGIVKKLKSEEIAEIKANQIHSAKVGKDGCTYLVGEGKK